MKSRTKTSRRLLAFPFLSSQIAGTSAIAARPPIVAFLRNQIRSNSSPRSVAITGAGVISPMGCGWTPNAEGFHTGRSALREITLFDTSRNRAHRGGEIDLPELPSTALTARQLRRIDRASQLVLHAAVEAWHQANWGESERQSAIPLIFGTSAGAMGLGEAFYQHAVRHPDQRHGQATRAHLYQTQNQILTLAHALEIDGPITVISNACASGANAIGHAFHLIRHGLADRAICGGYDALSELVFAGFDALHALSPTLPKPFDANRDGLALGEGAGVFFLEAEENALARNATILGRVTGYGFTTDVHHLTQPHPDGIAALASMRQATHEASLTPDQIDYINSHGTGTPLNDSAESIAIASWAGNAVSKRAVSSTKGAIGHLLGAAGAVEAVIALMTLREQWLPPSLNVETPDPLCQFDLVRSPRSARVDSALTNSFGFGGSNATLILQRP